MKKYNIVHIVGGINFGGVETVILNYFSYINSDKYNLHIISHEIPNSKCAEELEKIGFKIYYVPSKHENIIKNITTLYSLFKKIKPDIVHCHLTLSNYAPLIVAKLCGVKIRISHSHLSYENKNVLSKLYCLLIRLFCTHRMACGITAAQYLYGKKNDAIILNNAININKFKFDNNTRSKIRKKFGLDDNITLYGHIGRFHTQKNHIFLINLFNALCCKVDNAKLLLVGNGDLKNSILDLVEQLDIKDKVIFIDSCNEVSDYYQAMDIFLFPSLYEGLGMVLIEAQISGLPCIASENVPSETRLTDLVKFVSLKKDIDEWCNIILNTKINNNRKKYYKYLENSGYNIDFEYKKLDDFYKNILKDGDKNVKKV